VRFAREIADGGIPKRDAERLAAERRTRPTRRAHAAKAAYLHTRALADELTRDLATRVRITRRARGGTIEIDFYSDAELDRLVDRLRAAATPRA